MKCIGVGVIIVKVKLKTLVTFLPNFRAGGGRNGYVFKLNNQGQLVWGTYFGRTIIRNVNNTKIAVTISDKKTGQGNDSYYYTNDAYQTTASNQIIARFDPITGTREYSTYLGHDNIQIVHIAFADGFYYLAGQVYDSLTDGNLISNNAYQSSFGGMQDLYLGKFTEAMNPQWGTYIGGSNFDSFIVQANFVVKNNAIYALGFTTSN